MALTLTPNLARESARARPEGPAPTTMTSVCSMTTASYNPFWIYKIRIKVLKLIP